MFMLASHQFKNHPTNQDQLRGWKLADQAYWILLFLFGFSKFGFTGDVQNIRTHRSSSPHQSKWVQMSLDFEFCICIENVSKAVTLLCIPHVNLLTCCHTSNYIARNPRCPFGEPCHLSSSSLEPLRPAISKRSCTRHASERIIGLIVLGSIVQKSRWVLSVCIESADLKPFFLSAVAPQLWDVFASAKASRVWKSHGPGVSDSFETMLVTGIEAFWIRIWRGAWVRMWLSLRERRTTAPLIPLIQKTVSFVIEILFQWKGRDSKQQSHDELRNGLHIYMSRYNFRIL